MFSGKTPNQPYIIRTPAYPIHLNEAGFVKAGHVLKLIDIIGSEPAFRNISRRSKNGAVVTASLDRTNFYQPIRRWEMIRLESRMTRVWKSSMETQVKVFSENFRTGEVRDIATAYLVFVGLDGKTREKLEFPEWTPKTAEEHRLAREADLRKKNRQEEGRLAPFIPIDDATDKPTVLRREMTENDSNAQNNVFGGIILDIIDEAGSAAAKKQALGGTVVGVRQDRMSFIAPTFVGETVEARAIVTKTWRTSMEVQVEVDAINPNTNQRRKVASSYLVYVRLGSEGRPAEVPALKPETDLQKQRAEAADVRRNIREKEEREQQASPSPEDHLKSQFSQMAERMQALLAHLGMQLKGLWQRLISMFQ